MKNILIVTILLQSIILWGQSPVDFVDPFIGTSNYGATNPGAVMPAGMVSVVPFNVAFKKGEENKYEKDSEWHSRPYVYENKFLTGFTHVNLSGVGCPDLGSILLMPTTGELELDPEKNGTTYSNEEASPGYYTNTLDKYDIKTEMSATLRTGISRYTFPKGQSNILLNLGLGLTNETGAMLQIKSNTEVEGYKLIGTFCYHPEDVRPVYFVAKFSKPAKSYGAWKKMPAFKGVEGAWTRYNDQYKPYDQYQHQMVGDNIGTYFSFDTEDGESIEVKVGVSYVSIENARKNLEAEQADFDLEKTRNQNVKKWNDMLGRIQLEGGSKEDKTIFYTALYHVLLHPNIIQDVNGEYPTMESYGVKNANGKNRYTVFSLWDTYRNVHPFLSLVYPDLQIDMVHSMLDMYKESGWLPKWELLSMETTVMVGDPATPVIADTYLRGLTNFDTDLAYEAMKKSATQLTDNKLRPGIQFYDRMGYIPESTGSDIWGGTVSTTLEYNIADWNLAQFAKALGKTEDAQFFEKRSKSYQKYFDKSTGMLRPIMDDGKWLDPFNPEAGKNFEPVIGFVEGNAWQYRFYVPHDIKGLAHLLGGEQHFIEELQKCFDTDNYDMANEPDITYPFLFNYVKGEEWRTQKTVRELIRKYYYQAPDGIPGNDDTGTLSTWLLYSMMGFYPDCPGNMDYTLTSPVFDKIKIELHPDFYPGQNLVIETVNNQGDNYLIDQIQWNQNKHPQYFINHHELVKGGVLKFYLK
ncbi:MAG: GH92 family glycosyl hydrolase [Chitinophagales bacterium]|nr:GH92 family glycosyl hydrolase [Chitinophagales bacterium]